MEYYNQQKLNEIIRSNEDNGIYRWKCKCGVVVDSPIENGTGILECPNCLHYLGFYDHGDIE